MREFKVGDAIRISTPLPDVNKIYHNKIGRIESINHKAIHENRIRFINLNRIHGTVGFKSSELEKLSDKEALAWLI